MMFTCELTSEDSSVGVELEVSLVRGAPWCSFLHSASFGTVPTEAGGM